LYSLLSVRIVLYLAFIFISFCSVFPPLYFFFLSFSCAYSYLDCFFSLIPSLLVCCYFICIPFFPPSFVVLMFLRRCVTNNF
jgi:hypothetical protein